MNDPGDGVAIELYNSVGGVAYLRRLQEEWKQRGAAVTAFAALDEEAYRRSRGALGRIALRWRMYAGQAWLCWRGARSRRMAKAVRVVTTNPFFAPALAARSARGSGATINVLYDLFPDALIQAGRMDANSWMARRCAAITRSAFQHCSATVFLGERLRAHAEAAYGPARRAAVIPVGADGGPFKHFAPRFLAPGETLQILYSGQMGRMHETATLIAGGIGGEMDGIAWAFHASGAGYLPLRKAIGERPSVTWGGALPGAAWQHTMRKSAVALVTIAAGAERVVMPSKTYSAMVAGQAILAVCPRASDLADLIQRHDCGWVVEPGDIVAWRHVLRELVERPEVLWAKRRNAFEAGHREFDMGVVAETWMNLFAELRSEETGSARKLAAGTLV